MGRKKKHREGPVELPTVPIKKIKRNPETPLTAVLALQLYAGMFKLGQPSYREKSTSPYTISIVMNGSELGTGQHAEKSAAIEKAALITLHLLDPEAKSITANITHHDEAELKTLILQVINARQDEIRPVLPSTGNGTMPSFVGALAPPRAGGNLFPFPGALTSPTTATPATYPQVHGVPTFSASMHPPRGPMPLPPPPRMSFPMPQQMAPPSGGVGSIMYQPPLPTTASGTQNSNPQQAPVLPPTSNSSAPMPAPPPTGLVASLPGLVWIDQERSPEEVRSEMPRYHRTQQEAFDHDEQDDDDFIERALAEHEATEAMLAATAQDYSKIL